MAATGLLAALQGRDNWDVVRSERQRELQLTALQAQMAKQDFQEQQIAAAQIGDFLSLPGNIKVHDVALPGIQEAEDNYRKPVMEGIMKANGDVKKFLQTGGLTILKKYQNNLLADPKVAKGIMSSANYNKMVTDIQAGLVPRGKAEEDWSEYTNGKTDAFGYQGAYEAPDLSGLPKEFGEIFGPNPYQSTPVNRETFKRAATITGKKQGRNPADAEHYAEYAANQYDEGLKNGATPIMYGRKEWKPTAGWGTQQDNEEAVKYIVEMTEGSLKPAAENPDFWTESVVMTVPVEGNKLRMTKAVASPRGRGLNLGDAIVDKTKLYRVAGKLEPQLQATGETEQIKNYFQGYAQTPEGETYYHTTQSDAQGRLDPSKQWIKVTDGSIDELVLGAPAAQRPKSAANLRRVLREMKAYKNLTPAFNKGGKSYSADKELKIKENMAANPAYTREEIIQALGY